MAPYISSDTTLPANTIRDADTTFDFEKTLTFTPEKKFTLFPTLPLEPRLEIWGYAIPGSAGPRVIRVEAQEGWTRVQEQIIDEDGSGFAVVTTERFRLQFHSGGEGCSLYRTCTKSRQVVVERFPIFLPSAILNKKIRFGQSDILVIDKPHVLESNLKHAVKNGIKIPEALSALSHLHGLAIFAKYPSGACRLKIKMRLKSILAFAPYCKNLRTVFICLSSHYPEKVLDNSLSGYASDLSLIGRKGGDKGFVEKAMNFKEVIESTIQVEREKLKDNRLETLEIKIMVHVSILEGRRICV